MTICSKQFQNRRLKLDFEELELEAIGKAHLCVTSIISLAFPIDTNNRSTTS
jgi:hypothetical protein